MSRAVLTNVASWLLFVPALALALLFSFFMLNGASLWGLGQTVAAGPLFVLLFVYMTLLPVVFGAFGLFRASARRRLLAAATMLISLVLYMFVAAGESFDWF